MADDNRAHSGQSAFPGGDAPLTDWRSFYGFKTDPYGGGSTIYTSGSDTGQFVPVGTGFGGGDLRRAFKAGHSAHSIMKYLKGDDMVGSDGQFYQQGGTAIGQEAINDLRAQMSIEQGMKNMFHSYKGLQDKFSTLTDDYGKLKDRTGDLETTQGTQQTAIEQNKTLAEQVKINNPSTVTGGSALQIQGAGGAGGTGGSAIATLGAGIAGTKDDKKLTTQNLNV